MRYPSDLPATRPGSAPDIVTSDSLTCSDRSSTRFTRFFNVLKPLFPLWGTLKVRQNSSSRERKIHKKFQEWVGKHTDRCWFDRFASLKADRASANRMAANLLGGQKVRDAFSSRCNPISAWRASTWSSTQARHQHQGEGHSLLEAHRHPRYLLSD